MILLATGGRDYMDTAYVNHRLDLLSQEVSIDSIVEGGAPGADTWVRMWGINHGLFVQTVSADWNGPCREACSPNHRRQYSGLQTTYCPAAGVYRNRDMLEVFHPDIVLAFPGGKGTQNMIDLAIAAGVPVIQTARS